MNFQQPLARSLVIVRKTPFLVDLGVAACALALFFAIVSTGVYWFQKPIPVVPISNSIGALPLYAFYSIVRMAIAYLLSLAFAVSYGYIAAYNSRVEPWMVAVLDILQSIPVLSFLPPVVLAMVSLVPGHQLGIEMAVILLIFTGQVWNLAFSFYSSLKTIPREMLEASRIYRFSGWQRFWQLEMPFSAIGLVWNSIVSVAGGWFALIFCETFTMGTRNFQLPGLGSYIQAATNAGDVHALLAGIATVILIVVATDQLVWRPLIAWSDKFKMEQVESSEQVTSPILALLRRSKILDTLPGRIWNRVEEPIYRRLAQSKECRVVKPLERDKFRQGVAGVLGAGFCRGDRGLLGRGASHSHAEYRYTAGSAAPARRRGGDIPARQCGVVDLGCLDHSCRRGHRAESEAGADCAAAGADTRVRSRHSLFPDLVDRIGEDRRGIGNRIDCVDAAWNAVVHPVQRDRRSDGDSFRFARGRDSLPLHAVAAMDQAHSSRYFSVFDYGDGHGVWRRVERFSDGRVFACTGPHAIDHRAGRAD